MDDIKAKQQVVEKIKAAGNILVTVSNDPSLDALSAALGLALIIDKLDKHATTIFSGQAPQAMKFLEPEKTFENTTDSLRDFIIALDKEKADHLRLKVEGDVAKIYITPYRTVIKPEDLQFTQGDNYNIELVIALGVDNQDHLDSALDAHGQILHDAPVITITAGDQISQLGGVDWHDSRVSSLSEMIATLGEALKDQETLIDKQSATALLTGIVSATDRFSNPKTTSASMTVAAQLMSYGADQQLIANELQKSHEIGDGADMTSHGSETLADLDARVRDDEIDVSKEVEADIMNGNTSTSNAYGLVDESPPVADNQPPAVVETPQPELSAPEPPVMPPETSPSTSVNSAYALPEDEPTPVETQTPELQPAELSTTPVTPAELGLPMPPPVAVSSAYAVGPETQGPGNPPSERLGDILNPDPDETPGAPSNAIPILSHSAPAQSVQPPIPPVVETPNSNDPSQFKIPGQV